MTKKWPEMTGRTTKAKAEERSLLLEIRKVGTKRPTIRKRIDKIMRRKTTKRLKRKSPEARRAIRRQETKKVIKNEKIGKKN